MTSVEALLSCSFRFVLCFVFAVCSLLLFSRPLRFSSLFVFCYNLCFQALVYVSVSNRCLTWFSDHSWSCTLWHLNRCLTWLSNHHHRRLSLTCQNEAWIDPLAGLCSPPSLPLLLEAFWELLEAFWERQLLGAFDRTFGGLLGAFWEPSGSFVGAFWKRSGNLLASFWNLSRSFLVAFWEPAGSPWEALGTSGNLLGSKSFWKLLGVSESLLGTFESLLGTFW